MHGADFALRVADIQDVERGEAGEPVRAGDVAGAREEEGVQEVVVG